MWGLLTLGVGDERKIREACCRRRRALVVGQLLQEAESPRRCRRRRVLVPAGGVLDSYCRRRRVLVVQMTLVPRAFDITRLSSQCRPSLRNLGKTTRHPPAYYQNISYFTSPPDKRTPRLSSQCRPSLRNLGKTTRQNPPRSTCLLLHCHPGGGVFGILFRHAAVNRTRVRLEQPHPADPRHRRDRGDAPVLAPSLCFVQGTSWEQCLCLRTIVLRRTSLRIFSHMS